MKGPLVSVFIPMFNSSQYIREALDSIINQTYNNLEIIIIDDGSTDKSVEIVKSYNDSRIRLIQNECNKGIPYTRNLGLKKAKGKYMAIMDSDDISYSTRIERQVEFMEKNNEVDVVGSFYEIFGYKKSKTVKAKYVFPDELAIFFLFSNGICNSTALVRLDTIRNNNITYNNNYFVAQDYDFWTQVSKIGKLQIIPEVLVKYRTGHENITNLSFSKKSIERFKIINSIQKELFSYYGFKFSDKELEIFTDFFNDNYHLKIDKFTLQSIQKILDELIEQVNRSKIFSEKIFVSILSNRVNNVIANKRFNLKNKLKLYNKYNNSKNIKYLTYIILKEILYLLLQRKWVK